MFDAMEPLLRRMPVWITIAAMVAVVGWLVAQSTDDNTPPYDEGTVSTVAWVSFLAAGLIFIMLCVLAGLLSWRRKLVQRR